MAEPRAHEPKLSALAAYREGALGAEARGRLERHLGRCAVCREALSGLRRYARLMEGERGALAPELDWARMELPLQREAVRLQRARRFTRVGMGIGLAAAACLVAVLASRGGPAKEQAVKPRLPPAPSTIQHEPPQVAIHVVAVVGKAYAIDPSGTRHEIGLDTRPREGWTLHTSAEGELRLVLDQTAAVMVDTGTEVQLLRTREHDIELALEAGRVISRVHPLGAAGRFRVTAAGHEVAVRGTHFGVGRTAAMLSVQVDEGVVEVLRDGTVIAELHAPQHWIQRIGKPASTSPRARALPLPREPGAGFATWPALSVPPWPQVVRWDIDGAEFGAAGELAMRVPPGELDISALLADGRRMRGRVHVDPLGARFDPRGLELVRPAGTTAHEAAPDPAQASAVIRGAHPQLQRCYERSLRNQPVGALSGRLRVRIDGRGRVRDTDLSSQEAIPAGLGDCIRQVAKDWQFPASGGSGITFEAPIRFQPRQ